MSVQCKSLEDNRRKRETEVYLHKQILSSAAVNAKDSLEQVRQNTQDPGHHSVSSRDDAICKVCMTLYPDNITWCL